MRYLVVELAAVRATTRPPRREVQDVNLLAQRGESLLVRAAAAGSRLPLADTRNAWFALGHTHITSAKVASDAAD